MNWQEILTILIPIFGLIGWVYSRIEKRIDKFENYVAQEFSEVKKSLQDARDRLTRLEGRFEERGYWESREWHRTGTEDKK